MDHYLKSCKKGFDVENVEKGSVSIILVSVEDR